jgi:hypothetical protein
MIVIKGESIYNAIGNLKSSVKELVEAIEVLKDEGASPLAISLIAKTLNEQKHELKTLLNTYYHEERQSE